MSFVNRIDKLLDNFIDDIFVGVSSGVVTAHLIGDLEILESVKLLLILFFGLVTVGVSGKKINNAAEKYI